MRSYIKNLIMLVVALAIRGPSLAQESEASHRWAPVRDHWVQFSEVLVEGKVVRNLTVTFYKQTAKLEDLDVALWKQIVADRAVPTPPEHRVMDLHRGMVLVVADRVGYLLVLGEHDQISMFEADFRGKKDPVYMPSLDEKKLALSLSGRKQTTSGHARGGVFSREMEPWKVEAGRK
ncbi:hypothetical protein [Verrucomicrobium spinosum]|uniref:hypothetical protein n=1 Tax=Verrucomicrobium spinosum TaxID=2736 RepID=UPI0009464C78|nr:hypothetical protein [Verrucomicrobium spinosum]